MSAERPSEQEIARLREAFAGDCEELAPGSAERPCPAPERIWEALDGTLEPEALRDVVDHIALCPACAEEWRLAAAFRGELSDDAEATGAAADVSEPPGPADPATDGGRRVQIRSWLAAAAVAVLALGVSGVWWSTSRSGAPGTTEAPVYRQGAEQTIDSLLPQGRPLPRDEAVLRWTAGPEGSTYDVLVSTADLAAVADATGLTEPRYQIPADALEDLPAGAELLWQVEATTPTGKRISSKTFETRLE